MITKKYDLLQLLIAMVYLFMIFSLLYFPFEINEVGEFVRGYKSVINLFIIVMFFLLVLHPFGYESFNSIGGTMVFIWSFYLLSIYLKVFRVKENGEQVMWVGIVFPSILIVGLTVLLYLDRGLYRTGKKIERNESHGI